MDFPKLRALEAFPISVSGQRMIGLRDPLNFSSDSIAIPQQYYLMLTLFDGMHSVVDIQAEYMREGGELIYREAIEDVIKKLDEGLFLDNENFQRKRDEIVNAFRDSDVRPATLAGKSYDDSPQELAAQIEEFFVHDDGPGPIGRDKKGSALKGVIAPHSDFLRGGPCFAWAYKAIAEETDADLFVIFGTAHAPTVGPFVLTYKDFETPFSTLVSDRSIVEEIEKNTSTDLLVDEFAHKNEHSIEFQAVFLSYLFRERQGISIVPVLCGSFHEMILSGNRPIDDEQVTEFVLALKNAVASSGKKACYIAGADLAHVGPKFGDPHPISEAFLKLLESDDRRMLEQLEKVDADGFFGNIRADADRRKICGLPPIYTMLNVMDSDNGKLLRYDYFPDPGGTVSFASMAFY
jgi:AmmeMemoRadiSam system protein B